MKKLISALLIIAISVCMISCGGGDVTTTDPAPESTKEPTSQSIPESKPQGGGQKVELSAKTIEELEALVEKDVEDVITSLQEDFAGLTGKITTYDQYVANVDEVKAFYDKIIAENEQACIRLREYSIDYVQLILEANMPLDDKEDALDDMEEFICEDAEEVLYEGIYEGVLEDMFDYFYDGILSAGYDFDIYDEWLDIQSDEYDMYLDASSEVFDCLLDMSSDVCDFWLDASTPMWENDVEEVKEEMNDFREDIKELKAGE